MAENLVMARSELIVAAARECLGTPFEHQGRLAGVGLDCIGLLAHVAKRLGLPHEDCIAYHRRPGTKALMRELPKCGALDQVDVAEPGDVLTFWWIKPSNVSHCGIRTDVGLIHTFAAVSQGGSYRGQCGKVVEVAFGPPWTERVHSAWRFRWQS